MKNYRIVVLGSGGVGKTSLIHRFIDGTFQDIYLPTVEDIHRPIVSLPDGETHRIEILDTAGLHQFPAMRLLSIQSSRAFVIVYSITEAATFKEALEIAATVRKIQGYDAQVLIIGNKSDLSDRRQVERRYAHEIAAQENYIFTETSAKFGSDIHLAFQNILHDIFRLDSTGLNQQKDSIHNIQQGDFWHRLSDALRRSLKRKGSLSGGLDVLNHIKNENNMGNSWCSMM